MAEKHLLADIALISLHRACLDLKNDLYGGVPGQNLVADGTGAIFGTMKEGGLHGQGTVFRLTPPAIGSALMGLDALGYSDGRGLTTLNEGRGLRPRRYGLRYRERRRRAAAV